MDKNLEAALRVALECMDQNISDNKQALGLTGDPDTQAQLRDEIDSVEWAVQIVRAALPAE